MDLDKSGEYIVGYAASTPTIFMQPIVIDFKSIGKALGEALANNDILEVVRCEYCRHWNESDCHSTVVPIVRKCMCMNVYTDPDFFCKSGERSDDDNDREQ